MPKLPISDNSHDQERRSLTALNNAIDGDLFLLRSEDGGDYGVDRILELKIFGKHVSNFRAHSQVKSVANGKRNSDGSVSFAVPLTTLNYLYNQPNSLFILYLENEHMLLWEWVTEIVQFTKLREIDLENTLQETVSFRFEKILDRTSLELIHSRVVSTSTVVRNVAILINNSISQEPLTAFINTVSGSVITADESISMLKQHGIALANSGEFELLNKMISCLPAFFKQDTELAIVVSYIKLSNGEYYEAFACLPRGIALNNVTPKSEQLIRFLNIVLDHLLTISNEEKFYEKIHEFELSFPDSELSLQQKLFRLRGEVINSDPMEQETYYELLQEYNACLMTLQQKAIGNPNLERVINLVDWEIQGFILLRELLHSHFVIMGRENMGHPITLQDRISKATDYVRRHAVWFGSFEVLFKTECDDDKKALLYISFANLQLQFLANFRAINNNHAPSSDHPILGNIRDNLGWTINVLAEHGYVQETLRAKITLANCLFGLVETQQAFELATNTRALAETFGIYSVIQSADSFLNGQAIFALEELLKNEAREPVLLMSLSENELLKYIRQTAEMMELPEDRLPNLVIDFKWLREDEKQRANFCKNLESFQDKTHSMNLETLYSINPNRIFHCKVYGYESPHPGTERENLLLRFKADYCLGCPKKLV